MQQTTKSDHLLMSLVERVLARPKEDRQAYLQSACGNDNPELFSRVWTYVQAEERMGGFLLDPFDPPVEGDAPFEPGQLVLNRFRIIREIARGGMGIVWEAMDEKMELRVAIKCAKAGFGKQLPPEVRNARDISHPNVCNIFEIHTACGPQGEFDFISMEFLEGETLSDRLRRGPLSNKESLAIALQLCAGLAEAHRSNVIHGDLKSNNVILTAEPDGSLQAVIMDFGLARRQSAPGRISPTEVLAGTPAYMAPELWEGVKPSVASDIYALGVVLWELVSGRKPGDVGTVSTLPLSARGAWKLPAWHGRWDGIIARCLEENPAQRFHDADEVARALGPPRSRRWFLTAAAAAVLAIASGVVTYQRATAPPESVRLALLPFTSSNGDSSVSENLLRGTASQFARLKSSPHTKFTFIPVDKAHSVSGATHVLQGTLEQRPGEIKVHAYVTDVRSGVNTKEWTADYKPQEMRYAPGALAGVVTGALHLPLAGVATVNAAARTDYLAGLSAVRRDSGVDAALGFFERAVTVDPDSPLTYSGLAEAQWLKYFATRDKAWLNRTTESVRRAESRNPDLPQVHIVVGLLKANAGWYEQATAEYLRAIELEPANGDAYRRLGEAYRRNSQPGEALASFRKGIEVDPQQYRNFQALGSFYYKRANYEEAAKQFRTAVALAPNEAPLHYAIGAVELDLGHLDTAENELRTSIRLQETPSALHTLGLVLMYQKRDAQAVPVIVRALALGPERYLWWLDLGTAYRRVGRKSDAKSSYSRGLELAELEMAKNPRDGVVRAGLAYLCTQLGDRGRAESEIAQALQQSPEADARFLAALTYEALGRRNDAISILAASARGVIADVSRWPDVADLHKDSRFIQLLASHPEK
ncbi:MAG TPA: protein kinase [Bryobacteraceae bacterium]|jgi:serine/threonine protein kinase/thioredoxin-like negative regulator of GroEL